MLNSSEILKFVAYSFPQAIAHISGKQDEQGTAKFYDTPFGTIVEVEMSNLPNTPTNFFGMHIHSKGACEGDFSSAGSHFGEGDHPLHAGDLPPLLSADGTAYSVALTPRFHSSQIVGRSIIIHNSPDDFTTQPAGNSGERIACGIIEKYSITHNNF